MNGIIEISIYAATFLLCGSVVYFYLRKQKNISSVTVTKIASAKDEGRFEPISLYPYIDLGTCIGSAACITACPEKDILGLVENQASVINATSCVGHGACFHACPVEAISLRIGTESRGIELPHVNQNFETNVGGIFIAGELGGMGLIKNSVEQGYQAVENIAKRHKAAKITSNPDILDLAIIGAGPAGISGMLKAKELGLSVKTFEQDTLGGTVYSFPRAKLVMTNPMDLPLYGKVKLFDTSKDELLRIWNEALTKNNLTINENTKIDLITPLQNGTFKIVTSKSEEHQAYNVLVAIGRRGTPRKLNIPGEDLPKVYYRLLDSEQIEDLNIMVVGGGDSAVETALLLMERNNVILSYRKDAFSRIKQKNREKIKNASESKMLEVIFSSNVVSISEKTLMLKEKNNDDDTREIPNDLVYVFIGGELPTKFLGNAGINVEKRFSYVMKKY